VIAPCETWVGETSGRSSRERQKARRTQHALTRVLRAHTFLDIFSLQFASSFFAEEAVEKSAMASSVLGKRTRSSVDTGKSNPYSSCTANYPVTASSPATLRAKRQATASIFSDEDHGPFNSHQPGAETYNIDSMDLDELAEAKYITTTPVKKAAMRVALSPASIKTHFNTVKPSNGKHLGFVIRTVSNSRSR
jgi:hypothetical protein